MSSSTSQMSFIEHIKLYFKPPVLNMLFLGFSAGLPILLIFSSLSLWLREAGIDRSAVTYFSWAALGYSFKFIWAPLIDKLPVPFLTAMMGHRRAWLLVSQLAIAASIIGMALVDPAQQQNALVFMAIAAVVLGFSSATQDIVIDAYRIEVAAVDLQALLSAAYVAGYRVGMIAAGAGAIYLAQVLGSSVEVYNYAAWRSSYMLMSGLMLIGIITTLVIHEPQKNAAQNDSQRYSTQQYLRFLLLFACLVATVIAVYVLSAPVVGALKATLVELTNNRALAGFIVEALRLFFAVVCAAFVAMLLLKLALADEQMVKTAYLSPIADFFQRYGKNLALLLLLLIGFYRVSDIVLGVISNVFYQDLGFDKKTIAGVVKTFGLIMTIVGGFLGGYLSIRFGVMRILFLGAVLSALTNLLFMMLAYMGNDLTMLYVVISADNLAAGLASAAFIAFLSSLTNVSFTATQYAIFSSLMTLIPKVMGGYSGGIVDSMGYPTFFLITALMGLPVLYLVFLADKYLSLKAKE